MAEPSLDALQRWMLAVVTHPDGVEAGWASVAPPGGARELRELVPGNDRLTPTEQLHVYGFAYFERLIDILIEEYPGVQAAVGEGAFRSLCRAFLVDCPSTSWTLNRLSAPFPGWLEGRGAALGDARLAFAASVASVERAMDEVWDAPFEDPVSADALAAVPADGWADLRLRTTAAMRLLTLDHPVSAFMNAVRREEPFEIADPEPAWVLVHRRDLVRYRLPLVREQHDLLAALTAGATLGEALEAAAGREGADVGRMMASVGDWLRDLAARGIFVGLAAGA